MREIPGEHPRFRPQRQRVVDERDALWASIDAHRAILARERRRHDSRRTRRAKERARHRSRASDDGARVASRDGVPARAAGIGRVYMYFFGTVISILYIIRLSITSTYSWLRALFRAAAAAARHNLATTTTTTWCARALDGRHASGTSSSRDALARTRPGRATRRERREKPRAVSIGGLGMDAH